MLEVSCCDRGCCALGSNCSRPIIGVEPWIYQRRRSPPVSGDDISLISTATCLRAGEMVATARLSKLTSGSGRVRPCGRTSSRSQQSYAFTLGPSTTGERTGVYRKRWCRLSKGLNGVDKHSLVLESAGLKATS